jgi:hypothetical protein
VPFGLLAVLVRSDLSKDGELLVLRHENQVLPRQLGGRLWWDHADRLWLTALPRLVNRCGWPPSIPAPRMRPTKAPQFLRYTVSPRESQDKTY